MTQERSYKMLAVILTVSLVGAAALPAFGYCNSPCCGPTGCHPRHVRATPNPFHFVDVFLTEIKQSSCEMSKVQTLGPELGSGLRVPRTEPPTGVTYAAPYHGSKILFNSSEGPVMRSSAIPRAAPDTPLYLQNLTLLI